jgi:hypothetical protein
MKFPNAKHTIDQTNTIQQTIVMYECMNRKCDEFLEFGRKNHAKQSSRSKVWALEAYRGKMVFLGGCRVVLEFLEWFEGLGMKDRALRNLGIFQGFL